METNLRKLQFILCVINTKKRENAYSLFRIHSDVEKWITAEIHLIKSVIHFMFSLKWQDGVISQNV